MAKSVELPTLKFLCAELGVTPTIARDRLRTAARQPKWYPALAKTHKPNQPWEWTKGSAAEREVREVLTRHAADTLRA